MQKIRPLGNRALIKRSKAQTSKGGILLPDSAQEKPKEGTVVAVGPGVRDEEGKVRPPQVAPNDRVLFSSYAGTEVKNMDGDDEYILISEDDLLGILDK